MFGEAAHLLSQTSSPLHYFALLNPETGQSVARCGLFEQAGELVSPAAASFGSIEFWEPLPDRDLEAFLRSLVEHCRRLPVRSIRLVNCPPCYAPRRVPRLEAILARAGFRVVEESLNHHLPVGPAPFTGGLHDFERTRLRKSKRAGFRSGLWPEPDTRQLFDFIQAARRRKNYRMSLTFSQLQSLLTRFPEACRVFAVWKGERLAATSIGIRVSEDVLYHFQGADGADFLGYSPTVQLVETLYDYCRQHRIPVLDLGTSVSAGVALFKQRLGARPTLKRTYGISL